VVRGWALPWGPWLRPFVAGSSQAPETALTRSDLPYLAGAIGAGGIVGPVLLMAGLAMTDASVASLLLALESAATGLMAWFIFHESFDRRIAIGLLCLVAGALVLSWSGSPTLHNLLGPLAIVGACIAWGLDNNLTRKISLADPLQLRLRALSQGLSICCWVSARAAHFQTWFLLYWPAAWVFFVTG
jgi:drug/metabolite transporter (DMT)-like permease